MIDDERLLQILSVAHRTSMRGEGVSLSQALADTEYRAMRLHFDANNLRDVIDEHPELIDQWERYSEDKRTDGGWYLKASDSAIGSLTDHQKSVLALLPMLLPITQSVNWIFGLASTQHNKSLHASGGSVFRIMTHPAS